MWIHEWVDVSIFRATSLHNTTWELLEINCKEIWFGSKIKLALNVCLIQLHLCELFLNGVTLYANVHIFYLKQIKEEEINEKWSYS